MAIFAKVWQLLIVFNRLSSGKCRGVSKGGRGAGGQLPPPPHPLFGKSLLQISTLGFIADEVVTHCNDNMYILVKNCFENLSSNNVHITNYIWWIRIMNVVN